MNPQFDTLLSLEIKRIRDSKVQAPSKEKRPFSLEEYKSFLKESAVIAPTKEQIDNFMSYIQNQHRFFVENSGPGFKVITLLLPHEHGFSYADEERVKHFGYLYAYLLAPDNLTVRPDLVAYMDAVLPPEVIANAVLVPESKTDLEQWRQFYQEIGQKTGYFLSYLTGF